MSFCFRKTHPAAQAVMGCWGVGVVYAGLSTLSAARLSVPYIYIWADSLTISSLRPLFDTTHHPATQSDPPSRAGRLSRPSQVRKRLGVGSKLEGGVVVLF